MARPGERSWREALWLLLGISGFSLVTVRPAHAETASDPATARALFAEGRKLMAAKHYAEACPKFEESQRLDPGIGAMYNLADCWEKSGRPASAWAMFLDTAAAARAANQADRAKVAKDRASALEPKLSKLTIRIASPSNGLEVKRDGQVVAAASYDVPVPVDPGSHHIDVTAPGKQPYSTNVDVGGAAAVSVQIPKLDDAAATPASASPVAATSDASPAKVDLLGAAATDGESVSADHKPSRALPYTLLGVGAAGVIVGAIFEVKSRGNNSDALKICQGDSACTQPDIARHDGLVKDAKTANLIALVAGGVGAAGLITGAVLLATAPSSEKPKSAALGPFQLDFGAGPQGGAVFAKGSF